MPFISANGVTLCYETDGDQGATPLLLIMGLGMQLTSWPEEMITQLVARGYFVIRLDNRDSGLSSKMDQFGKPNLPFAFLKSLLHLPLGSPYSLYDMAQDSLAVLDALHISKAHIVGVSMGGMIAQILAGQSAQRCHSLTSIMSTSGRPGLPGPTVAARKVLMSRPKKPYQQEQVIDQLVNTFRVIGSPAYPTPQAQLRERIGRSMARNFCPQGTARQMVAIAASGSRSHLLRQTNLPSLVMHGAADPLVPLACGKDTAQSLLNSQLRVFPGMGHDLPEALVPQMVAMLDAHCQGKEIPYPQA